MKTRKPKQSKRTLLAVIGVVAALVVVKTAGGSQSVGLGWDLSSLRVAIGWVVDLAFETVMVWFVAIPAAAYLVYLAFMQVAPAQMRRDHAERTSKRTRKWAIIGTLVLIVVAYALHYVPILIGRAVAAASERAAATGSAFGTVLRAVGDHWASITLLIFFAAALGAGYWWSTKSDSKIEQIARFGMVGIPAVLVFLVLGQLGVVGA